MTEEDKALVGRLRKDTNETDTWNRKKNWTEQRSERRKAAARIEALSAENERLREALKLIYEMQAWEPLSKQSEWTEVTARAALGEAK